MAKQRRGATPHPTRKKATARKGTAPRSTRTTAKVARRGTKKAAARPAAKPAPRRPAAAARPAAKPAPRRAAVAKPQPAAAAPPPPPAPAPAPPRKPGFYEAVAIYERGVQALQRHDFKAGAEAFRAVIDKYPEERELLERARLYLRVCERETERQAAAAPQSAGDHVYAATVALNSGDHSTALGHLQRALTVDAENDHAHYIMAAALSMRGRRDEAIEHLQRSIALNPENRSQARQDPDLESLRSHQSFRAALDTPPAARSKTPRRK